MNHRHRHAPQTSRNCVHRRTPRFAATVLSFALAALLSSTAMAQRGGLPSDLKTAPDVRPRVAEIKAFIDAQVKALADDKKPEGQQRARDFLVREGSPGAAQPSVSYYDAYTTALNDALLPLAKSQNARVRLNAAIIVQRVAKSANNGKLAGVTAALAQDSCAGVVIWAIRAAQFVLPTQAGAGAGKPLADAVLEGAKKQADNGDVIEDAYKALTLGGNMNKVTDKSSAVVTEDVLKLLEFRVGQYVKKTPPRPELERSVSTFLSLQIVWKSNPKLRPQIVQQLANLAAVTAQHSAARADSARKPFVDQFKYIGGAIEAIGNMSDVNDAKIKETGKALTELQVQLAGDEYTSRAKAAFDALQAKFKEIKETPTIDPTATEEQKEADIVEDPTTQPVIELPPDETPATTKPTTKPAAAPAKSATSAPAGDRPTLKPIAPPTPGKVGGP